MLSIYSDNWVLVSPLTLPRASKFPVGQSHFPAVTNVKGSFVAPLTNKILLQHKYSSRLLSVPGARVFNLILRERMQFQAYLFKWKHPYIPIPASCRSSLVTATSVAILYPVHEVFLTWFAGVGRGTWANQSSQSMNGWEKPSTTVLPYNNVLH